MSHRPVLECHTGPSRSVPPAPLERMSHAADLPWSAKPTRLHVLHWPRPERHSFVSTWTPERSRWIKVEGPRQIDSWRPWAWPRTSILDQHQGEYRLFISPASTLLVGQTVFQHMLRPMTVIERMLRLVPRVALVCFGQAGLSVPRPEKSRREG